MRCRNRLLSSTQSNGEVLEKSSHLTSKRKLLDTRTHSDRCLDGWEPRTAARSSAPGASGPVGGSASRQGLRGLW